MHERCTELEAMNMKTLLDIAKGLQVVGRHEMTKKVLVNAIVAAETPAAVEVVIAEEPSDLELELAKEVGTNIQWEDQPSPTTNSAEKKIEYVENAKIGQLVAFKVNDKKALSGMIDEIHATGFIVKTKNGIRFTVRKKNIMWVKTGDRWPKGVYLALKGEHLNGPVKAAN